MIRRPPRSTQSRSSAASDVYKRQSPASSLSYLLALSVQIDGTPRGYLRKGYQQGFTEPSYRRTAGELLGPGVASGSPQGLTRARDGETSCLRSWMSEPNPRGLLGYLPWRRSPMRIRALSRRSAKGSMKVQ